MNQLEKLFSEKQTENGDKSYSTTGNILLDLLFMTEYYSKHLDEIKIGCSNKEKLFSRFIRDPRYGMGKRDLGRVLMYLSGVSAKDVVKSGRFDDLIFGAKTEYLDYIMKEAKEGNELAKKWLPRLNSKNKAIAKILCKMYNITPKTYRKLIKTNTVENKLSRKKTEEIIFEQVPSLALIKYYQRFLKGEDTSNRFNKYLENVKCGKKELKISTTTVYDIYKNRNNIDADLFFDKIEKIKINCIPILDTSGSMWDSNDSIGKASSIAHYLSKCSSYCNGNVISFSSEPKLIKIDEGFVNEFVENNWNFFGGFGRCSYFGTNSKYCRELNSMYTGDCSNTDFGAVMEMLRHLDELPEYIVVLSDMEFDNDSNIENKKTLQSWKDKGYKTKLIWWNFNARNTTAPELDENGNIFMSGYSPMLLKYLECGFNGEQFLDKLLNEYEKKIKD